MWPASVRHLFCSLDLDHMIDVRYISDINSEVVIAWIERVEREQAGPGGMAGDLSQHRAISTVYHYKIIMCGMYLCI